MADKIMVIFILNNNNVQMYKIIFMFVSSISRPRDYGHHFYVCFIYLQAMKHFLRCNPEDGQAIELAIETVGRANDDSLTAQLVEFLMGDIDGMPKVSGRLDELSFLRFMCFEHIREDASGSYLLSAEADENFFSFFYLRYRKLFFFF
jgi:WD repeat-containing protein 19